jgi:predicted amidohydrolase
MLKHPNQRVLLVGGRVIDVASGIDRITDILVENGRMLAIGQKLEQPTYDAKENVTGCRIACLCRFMCQFA